MYGEIGSVRARARALREIAEELASRARSLCVESEGVAWRSPAGDAFRDQLRMIASDIGAQATALHNAAEALERHASAVDRAKSAIQDAQAWVTTRLNEAAHAVRQAGEATVGAVEHAIASAARNAPRAGSKEWIEFKQLFERRGWA